MIAELTIPDAPAHVLALISQAKQHALAEQAKTDARLAAEQSAKDQKHQAQWSVLLAHVRATVGEFAMFAAPEKEPGPWWDSSQTTFKLAIPGCTAVEFTCWHGDEGWKHGNFAVETFTHLDYGETMYWPAKGKSRHCLDFMEAVGVAAVEHDVFTRLTTEAEQKTAERSERRERYAMQAKPKPTAEEALLAALKAVIDERIPEQP